MQATILTGDGQFRTGRIVDHLGQGWLEIDCADKRIVGRDVDHPATRRQLDRAER